MKTCIGIDLGGTKIMAGVIDEKGQIIHQLEVDTPTEGDDVLASILSLCQRLKEDYPVGAIGLGTPGQIAFPEGVVLGCTPNLKNWEKRNLRQNLEDKVHLDVVVDNDANVATFAELKVGSGKGFKDFVLLTLGTGLGSGRVSGGQLSRGFHNLGIGYGHMIIEARGRYCNCGQQGCLESYVSGTGIVKTYRLKGGSLSVTSPEIFARAAAGEERAQETLAFTWEMLAIAVVNIFNTLAPEVILLGGGISRQGENVILAPLRANVAGIMGMPFEMPESIRLASLRSQAGMIGAGLMAFDLF
jgi:glucokinase